MDSTMTTFSLEGQQQWHGLAFPLGIQAPDDLATLDLTMEWAKKHRDELIQLAAEHGAVLFRGFPLATADDLDAFIAGFGLPNFAYKESLSNAVRVNRTERVFTANEAPPDVSIYLHHEMAQTPVYPSRLFFFCEQPAEQGGATPICRSDILFERLEKDCPRFSKDCREKGLRYSNVMPPSDDFASGMGRSWGSTLRAETREQAEARLRGLGYEWEWLDDGSLRATTPVLPAVMELKDGRATFFNQLIAAFHWSDSRNDPAKAIRFGDGSPLPTDDVMHAVRLGDELAFDVPWQRGDVALVDNFVTMHGRRPFVGTRKVLASLVAVE